MVYRWTEKMSYINIVGVLFPNEIHRMTERNESVLVDTPVSFNAKTSTNNAEKNTFHIYFNAN